MVSKIFAFENIRNMNFNNRNRNRANSISYRDRSMGVSSGIKYNAIVGKSGFVEFVYKCSFRIRLEIIQLSIRKKLLELLKIIFEGLIAVNCGFTFSQQVQVWSVDNLYSFHEDNFLDLIRLRIVM